VHKLVLDREPQRKASNAPGIPLDVALNWDIRFDEQAGALSVENSETVVTLSGFEPRRCRAFLDRLDGEHSMDRLCEESGLGERECTAIIAALLDSGVAHRVSAFNPATGPMSGPQFAKACRDLVPRWKNRLFGHSLWRRLTSGAAPRALFQGWLLENFHFIEGVTLRLGAATAHCADPVLRRHFIKHFAEEYDHCEFFRRALRACGMSNEEIDAGAPLAGTLAVIYWARDAARKDPLCYAACSAFLESTGSDRQSAIDFFQRLAEKYEPSAVKHMAQHAQLDEDYDHAGFLEKFCADTGNIDRPRADRAIESLRGFVETLELWSTAVERHYSDESTLRPCPVRIYGVTPGTIS